MSCSTGPAAVLVALLGIALVGVATGGCVVGPSPLRPFVSGSVGFPHRGVLTDPQSLPLEATHLKLLRDNERRFGAKRLVDAIERAAAYVARERPGPRLVVGDLSARGGGMILPHFSHRSGRDADLLFFVRSEDGVPLESSGFVPLGSDGVGYDRVRKRTVVLDIDRQWLLVKALVEDADARVQWLFCHRGIRTRLLEWGRARGEATGTLYRAAEVLAQPVPGGAHDDHLHVRVACDDEERARGCEPFGPERPWLRSREPSPYGTAVAVEDAPVRILVAELLEPLYDGSDPSETHGSH